MIASRRLDDCERLHLLTMLETAQQVLQAEQQARRDLEG
jgi:hypothetical protein